MSGALSFWVSPGRLFRTLFKSGTLGLCAYIGQFFGKQDIFLLACRNLHMYLIHVVSICKKQSNQKEERQEQDL